MKVTNAISVQDLYNRVGIEGAKITNVSEIFPDAHNPLIEWNVESEQGKPESFIIYKNGKAVVAKKNDIICAIDGILEVVCK